MPRFDPAWREKWADRVGDPAWAVQPIKPGDTVFAGAWTSTPPTLCAALAARAGELRDIRVISALGLYDWDRPEILEHYRIASTYTSPVDRAAARAGRIDYIPALRWRHGQRPPPLSDANVVLVPISAPDEDGWCSFGTAVWFGPSFAASDVTLIGEVHPEFIRTAGTNRVHITRFARVAEHAAAPELVVVPPRSEETELAANIICTLVATELVYDGATLQFGIGDVSAALPVFLEEKHDLGVHTELLPGGIPNLIEKGVVTGARKALHPGKVVATGGAQLTPEELAYIDGNETFELYDFTYTDDLRNLLQFENLIAVNNALAVDITGNVASETMGPQIFSGTGGQSAFTIGASTAANGSVIVLPSSSLVGGTRHTRIVGGHAAGTVVTAHRGYVDYVVTEQGIAHLTGKSLRQRMNELISVAHPDFRAELRREAQAIYGLTV